MKTDKDFSGVTHFTQVDVQPGGINIQHVENLYQADILKDLGIELAVRQKPSSEQPAPCKTDEELCHFIHPALDEEGRRKAHEEIKSLVKHHQLKDIISYLKRMAAEKRILLPMSVDGAYKELERMGMPTSERGFSLKNFYKDYPSSATLK
ncbi:MAG: hypothetical protein IKW91_08010 [Bacteroidaceae bacterium]|nr:hypothetical protein [Bacteroidaceae bacterium]